MLNNLLIAAVLTGLLYFYNDYTNAFVDNTQYLLAFLGFALGTALLTKFLEPKGIAPPNIMEMVGLEEPSNGSNGEPEVPCYNVPYHVVSTQYGDKAVLAGYNENVQPYQTGAKGKFEDPYRGGDKNTNECIKVGYREESV